MRLDTYELKKLLAISLRVSAKVQHVFHEPIVGGVCKGQQMSKDLARVYPSPRPNWVGSFTHYPGITERANPAILHTLSDKLESYTQYLCIFSLFMP